MKSTAEDRALALKKDLESSPFFRRAPEKFLKEMVQLLKETPFKKGTIILKENSRAGRLFLLLEGTVALSLHRGGGEVVIEIVKKKGSLFGWSALVTPRKYTATAKALEDMRALSISGSDLKGLLQRYPSFGLLFLQRLASLIATRLHHVRSLLAETVT
ncbi:MAG: cyclic nucleotide-binding domain-containing protein [Deltaproteobacteria bacterium]|nr:cyclic nucleotide-binding domain-containing protein [Deltaproteobacteria bacterium]